MKLKLDNELYVYIYIHISSNWYLYRTLWTSMNNTLFLNFYSMIHHYSNIFLKSQFPTVSSLFANGEKKTPTSMYPALKVAGKQKKQLIWIPTKHLQQVFVCHHHFPTISLLDGDGTWFFPSPFFHHHFPTLKVISSEIVGDGTCWPGFPPHNGISRQCGYADHSPLWARIKLDL